MAYLLFLETATEICSVSLFNNETHLSTQLTTEVNSHSKVATTFVQQVLQQQQLSVKDLAAVAVSSGPGSYTGLRIGVSIAKGICYSMGIPLIAIPTLQAMAASMLAQKPDYNGLLCPMIDARRNEVYTALYDNMLNMLKPAIPLVINTLPDFYNWSGGNHIIYFGSGSQKNKSILLDDNVEYIDYFRHSSEYSGKLIYNKFLLEEFENIAYFEPEYLKILGERIEH